MITKEIIRNFKIIKICSFARHIQSSLVLSMYKSMIPEHTAIHQDMVQKNKLY